MCLLVGCCVKCGGSAEHLIRSLFLFFFSKNLIPKKRFARGSAVGSIIVETWIIRSVHSELIKQKLRSTAKCCDLSHWNSVMIIYGDTHCSAVQVIVHVVVTRCAYSYASMQK